MNLVKLFPTIIISLVFVFLLIFNVKVGLALSLCLLLIPLYWIISKSLDEKQVLFFFIFIHPIMPLLWGVKIADAIPIIHSVRLLTIAYFIFLIQKRLLFKYYKDFFKTNIFTFPIIMILLSMLVSSLFSSKLVTTIFYLFAFPLETLIIPAAVFSVCKTREDINQLAKVICYSTLVLILLGCFEKFTQYNFYNSFGTYLPDMEMINNIRRGQIRIRISFDHPIATGSHFALVLPFIIYYLRDNYFLRLVAISTVFIVITFTDSRAGQVGFIIIFIFYFIFVEKHRIFYSLMMILPFSSGTFRYRIMTLNPFFSGDPVLEGSTIARGDQFRFLTGFIKDNLFFGYGLDTVPALMRGVGNYVNSIDNYYLLYTFYYGIIGLMSWTLLMLYALIKPVLYLKWKIFDDKLLILLIGGTLAFCLINSVVALISLHFMFWVYLGVITRVLYNYANNITD